MALKNYVRLIGVVSCLLILFGLAGCKAKAPEKENFDLDVEAPAVTETEAPKELSVTDLLKAVTTMKNDLETSLEDIKNNELEAAKEKVSGLSEKTETVRTSMAVTLENLGDSTPSLKKELLNIQELLDLADQLSEKILLPTIEMMQEHSAEQMQDDGNIRTALLCEYLDFAESLIPEIESLIAESAGVDFSLVDSDGDIGKYLETAEELLAEYHENPLVLDAVKSIFGDGEDRVYLIAVQNTSEVRASGGFPGAMGVVRIRDGRMEMQDFKKVYDVLSDYTPTVANVTLKENQLFHYGLQVPRDADYCPDYERVAYIWSLGYTTRQAEELDGVISMTPIFAERLLKVMDEEIKLFDGTIVNGDNAEKVLQHDIYFNYYGEEYIAARNAVSDQLFADAAKKIMQRFTENLEIGDLMSYLSLAKESVADRTLMLWMADEEEQKIIRDLGWHGGLNSDPEKPQAGVYVNCTDAGKMGMFLGMETVMGERVRNEDGSYTYPITVTFTNSITDEEKRVAQRALIGRFGGAVNCSAYFFAPAGGTVSDITTSNDARITMDEYNGLQLGYWKEFNVRAGQPLTVTYNVTTAPGVETQLEFSKTPTIEYIR